MSYRVWILAFLALAGSGRAQTMDQATRALVEKLQDRIDSLEKRLAELEKGSVT